MKIRFVLAGLVASALVGCGGGGGGSTPAPVDNSFKGDGLYVNSSDLSLMVLDSKRKSNNLIVGDFANSSVYFVDSATSQKDTMKTKGVSMANSSSYQKLANQELTATVKSNAVTLTGTVADTNLIYSMDKTSDSLPLSQIVGTHTNPTDGSTWTINADGSFNVNGICTISGKLVRNGAYYNVTGAKAVSCSATALNGLYNGVLVTVEHKGANYIAGLLGNDSGILWGHAPKS